MLNAENFMIHEVTRDEISDWIKEEFKHTHPIDLIEATFPEKVMQIISSDHHKSRDYAFSIHYNHSDKKWYIEHPGYVRDEVEGRGASYLEAANDYLAKVRRANELILYRGIEEQANRLLPQNLSVEIGDNSVTLREYDESGDRTRTVAFRDIKKMEIPEIIKEINEISAPYIKDETGKIQ